MTGKYSPTDPADQDQAAADLADAWPIVCPHCGAARAAYLGRMGAYRYFCCVECGAEMRLQEREETEHEST